MNEKDPREEKKVDEEDATAVVGGSDVDIPPEFKDYWEPSPILYTYYDPTGDSGNLPSGYTNK